MHKKKQLNFGHSTGLEALRIIMDLSHIYSSGNAVNKCAPMSGNRAPMSGNRAPGHGNVCAGHTVNFEQCFFFCKGPILASMKNVST